MMKESPYDDAPTTPDDDPFVAPGDDNTLESEPKVVVRDSDQVKSEEPTKKTTGSSQLPTSCEDDVKTEAVTFGGKSLVVVGPAADEKPSRVPERQPPPVSNREADATISNTEGRANVLDATLLDAIQNFAPQSLPELNRGRHVDQSEPGAYAVGSLSAISRPQRRAIHDVAGVMHDNRVLAEAPTVPIQEEEGLARAVLVPDEEQPAIHADEATQQNMESNKQIQRQRFARQMAWIFVFILAILVSAVVIPVVLMRKGKSSQGSNQDDDPSKEGIHDFIGGTPAATNLVLTLPNYTLAALKHPDSPQYHAYEWLVNDPNLETMGATQKLQRFALATIYFSTRGPTSWKTNTHWLDYEVHECDFFNLASLPPLAAEPCAQMDDGSLLFQALALPKNNMVGSLPQEIGLLSHLGALVLPSNFLMGSIPIELWQLPQLQVLAVASNQLRGMLPFHYLNDKIKYLDLSLNGFTGTIPSQVGLLKQVFHLGITDNDLTGTIPTELGGAVSLDTLAVSANLFTGSIPKGLFHNHSKLQHFEVRQNLLSNTIPTEIALSTDLRHMYVYTNSFSGNFPTELGLLTHLSTINAAHNQLVGSIPDEFWSLSKLQELQLYRNQITGTIPHDVGQKMRDINRFMVGRNQMHGTIPHSMGDWSRIHELVLGPENSFDGTLPQEVWNLSRLTSLEIVGINVTGKVPSNFGLPELEILDLTDSHMTGTLQGAFCSIETLQFTCSEKLCGCDCACGR